MHSTFTVCMESVSVLGVSKMCIHGGAYWTWCLFDRVSMLGVFVQVMLKVNCSTLHS